ncbi:MAG: hypothetical protein M3433_03080 [Actinomycetota bacterium]|nr:hypothetical protein [Actinomycetota bacterium]
MAIRESAYFRALQTALYGAGLPYGYAVTVWATGSALAGEHGVPTEVEIFLFAMGATSAYGGLRLLTGEAGGEAEKPLSRSPHLVRAGLVHIAAIGAAITAALLIAQIPGSAAWLLATLAATLLYLGVSSVEVATVESGDGASASGD